MKDKNMMTKCCGTCLIFDISTRMISGGKPVAYCKKKKIFLNRDESCKNDYVAFNSASGKITRKYFWRNKTW